MENDKKLDVLLQILDIFLLLMSIKHVYGFTGSIIASAVYFGIVELIRTKIVLDISKIDIANASIDEMKDAMNEYRADALPWKMALSLAVMIGIKLTKMYL